MTLFEVLRTSSGEPAIEPILGGNQGSAFGPQ